MPDGFDLTLPLPCGVTVSWTFCNVNVAVTVVAASSGTVHGAVPEQPPPDQPVNVEPVLGVAVRITLAPTANCAVQAVPQSIPGRLEATLPAPFPASVTVNVSVWGLTTSAS